MCIRDRCEETDVQDSCDAHGVDRPQPDGDRLAPGKHRTEGEQAENGGDDKAEGPQQNGIAEIDTCLLYTSTIFFGLLGYLMKKIEMPSAPFVLSLVLGNLFETNFRQSMILSDNSPVIFFTRPISCVIMLIAIAVIFKPLLSGLMSRTRKKSEALS